MCFLSYSGHRSIPIVIGKGLIFSPSKFFWSIGRLLFLDISHCDALIKQEVLFCSYLPNTQKNFLKFLKYSSPDISQGLKSFS